MNAEKPDRRIQRTRELLHKAILELIAEKGYNAVKIQDITERANIGRTTFYAHFNSKEELFASAHVAEMARPFQFEELLTPEPSAWLITQFEIAAQNRALFLELRQGIEMTHLQRDASQYVAAMLEETLRAHIVATPETLPLEMVAGYLVNSHFGFVLWWLESGADYTPLQMARAYQQMRRAVLRDVLNPNGTTPSK
jgi:AcrR family transcriptional regulator